MIHQDLKLNKRRNTNLLLIIQAGIPRIKDIKEPHKIIDNQGRIILMIIFMNMMIMKSIMGIRRKKNNYYVRFVIEFFLLVHSRSIYNNVGIVHKCNQKSNNYSSRNKRLAIRSNIWKFQNSRTEGAITTIETRQRTK